MDVGLLIKEKIKKKDSNQSKVAKELGKTSQTLNQQLGKLHIDTELIVNISIVLKHNIFYDLAVEFEKESGIKFPRTTPALKQNSDVNDAIVEMLKEKFPKIFK